MFRTITELEEEMLATFHGTYTEEALQEIARRGDTWFPEWYNIAEGLVPYEVELLLQIAQSEPILLRKKAHVDLDEHEDRVSPAYLLRQNIIWHLDSYLSQYWKREYLKRERGAK